jgi:hypothetical protein
MINLLLILTFTIIIFMICRTHYLEYQECQKYQKYHDISYEDEQTNEEVERFVNSAEANEALQNIASVYNGDKLIVKSANIDDLTTNKTNTAKIMFSNEWQGYPDNATDQAEICNDPIKFKSLMIAGNKAYGGVKEKRNISMWDNVTVGSSLSVGANFSVNNDALLKKDLFVLGKTKFRKLEGVRAGGDNFITTTASSFEDCADKCSNVKGALGTLYHNSGSCSCTNAISVHSNDDEYTSGFMI